MLCRKYANAQTGRATVRLQHNGEARSRTLVLLQNAADLPVHSGRPNKAPDAARPGINQVKSRYQVVPGDGKHRNTCRWPTSGKENPFLIFD
jgi:hypothetical protein